MIRILKLYRYFFGYEEPAVLLVANLFKPLHFRNKILRYQLTQKVRPVGLFWLDYRILIDNNILMFHAKYYRKAEK